MIWVEVLSRHRDVAARFRCAGPEVRIGRAYDNDVVVDDPYVAAAHVRVFRDEAGRLVAEDIGSLNGMFLDRDRKRHERIVIDGERPIRIGRTYLRIREAGHAVPHERAARPEARALPVVLVVVLGALILGIDALSVWLNETGEPKASHYLAPLLAVVGFVVAWVGLWALLTRIFAGSAHFVRNLLIALVCLLAFSLYNEFAQFSAFALAWRTATNYDYVAMWTIVGAACFFHLREVGPTWLKTKAALVVSVLALVVGVETLKQSEAFHDSGRQSTVRRLLPPALRLAPVRDASAFFDEIEQLKARLDRDRSEAREHDGRP